MLAGLKKLWVCYNLVVLAVLLSLILNPKQVHAQWLPFKFDLTPSFADNKITYYIEFDNQADWTLMDVALNIPLPKGTRFLEAGARPETSVEFDGTEVRFLTATVHGSIRDAYFTVEITDPTMTVFSTFAWISWKGEQSGSYLTEEFVFDTTVLPLNWSPPRVYLQLDATASVSDSIVTYKLYPRKLRERRMWDLQITASIPPEATFLSVTTPPPFVANFNGQDVSFAVLEMDMEENREPLTFQVSTTVITSPVITTHLQAIWKNVGRRVGQRVAFQETLNAGDIVVNPHVRQQSVIDPIGDVPFANYDLTGITLEEEADALKIIFYLAGELGPVGQPLDYTFYIDSDCRSDTGDLQRGRGAEYRVRYRHNEGETDFRFWQVEGEEGSWRRVKPYEVNTVLNEQTVTLSIPLDSLNISRQFCWLAEARNRTDMFSSWVPTERIPNDEDSNLARYETLDGRTETIIITQPLTSPIQAGGTED